MPSIVPKWAQNNRAYGSFRRKISNKPRVLLIKIAVLQLFLWSCFAFAGFILSYTSASATGLSSLFRFENIGLFKGYGTTISTILFLLTSCIGYFLIWINQLRGLAQRFIVERGRLCLDFSITCIVIHYIASVIISKQIPWRIDVYGIYIGAVALMISSGVLACQQHELMPILVTTDPQFQSLMGKKCGSNEDTSSRWQVGLFGGF